MDAMEPAAFLSYVRADDDDVKGAIRGICERLGAELRAQTGRYYHIFVDRTDIGWGENWRSRINESLDMATLLIPILTPSYFISTACREELTRFLERERQLDRRDLILSIYYIVAPQMEDEELRAADPLAQELATRQYVDWRSLRFASLDSVVVRKTIEDLARRMQKALERGVGAKSSDSLSTDAPTMQFEALTPKSSSADDGTLEGQLRSGTAMIVFEEGHYAGSQVFIDQDTTSIGRNPDSLIFLDDITVSHRHARILRRLDAFEIEDLGSINTVIVNDQPVTERSVTPLTSGDRVRIGRFWFRFYASIR